MHFAHITYALIFVVLTATQVLSVSYRAAVLEYKPIVQELGRQLNKSEAQKIMLQNLEKFRFYTEQAASRGAKIIVFPEDGLYGAAFSTRNLIFPYLEEIPEFHQNEKIIPCTDSKFNDRPVFQTASCIARKYKMVFVLNMGDVQFCSSQQDVDCPPDGRWQFNTQVVFDADGRYLGKYHKTNLYHESQFDKGKGEAVTFKAFGTTFGLLICFDILHGTPVKELLKQGVKNFVFSSWWVNKPPIIAAVQFQQGWSRWQQVNLLAPNAGTNWFNSGSGIYSKGVELTYFYNPTSQPKDVLLIADVNDDFDREMIPPKNSTYNFPEQRNQVNATYIPKPFHVYPGARGEIRVETPGPYPVRCYASYHVSQESVNENETYALVAATGKNYDFDSEFCTLIKCKTPQCRFIERSMNTQYIFLNIQLNATFSRTKYIAPMLATNEMQLVPANKYTFTSMEYSSNIRSNPLKEKLVSATLLGIVTYN